MKMNKSKTNDGYEQENKEQKEEEEVLTLKEVG